MHILEDQVALSNSKLWELQREFYSQQGIAAWSGEVPFYITSNPFIANSYAKIILRFIQDWQRLHPETATQPFYFVELGAGSGQFSFYLLKRIIELQQAWGVNATIRYVMTDFTQNNIDFWKKHDRLQPYLKAGQLDFALLDFEHDNQLQLLVSGECVQEKQLANPITVIANYLFDSIVCDIFNVHDSELRESKVTVKTPDNNVINNKAKDLSKIKLSFTDNAIGDDYYGDQVIDRVLNQYKSLFTDTHFLFPIGSLRGLARLEALSQAGLLLLSSDKGYTTIDEMDELEPPGLDIHGSFSLMVNYHAFAQYVQETGGRAVLPTPRDGLVSAVFSSGFDLADLSQCADQVQESIEGFSPTDYFNFYEHLEKVQEKASLAMLASFLNFSHWDPYIFELVSDRLQELVEKSDTQTIDYLVKYMPAIAANTYQLPGSYDILFDIGLFFYALDDYAQALEYYQRSIEQFGETYESYFNLGLCHYQLDNLIEAKSALEQALVIKPRDKDAREWLKITEKELAGA